MLDERLKTILDGIGDAEFAAAAAGALGAERATLVGSTEFVELSTPHFDRKTIGIVRASGLARSGDGAAARPWSTVAKISDLSLAPNEGSVTHVEDEATVYEQRLFAGDRLRFRPARCYAISRPTPSIRVLWLEDLIDAKSTPFDVRTLKTIMRHLGEWNGYHAVRQTTVTIPIQRDNFVARWNATGFSERLKEFPDFADAPGWRVAFGDLPSSIVPELYGLLDQLVAQAATLPHAVAFGDLAAGNVFLKGDVHGNRPAAIGVGRKEGADHIDVELIAPTEGRKGPHCAVTSGSLPRVSVAIQPCGHFISATGDVRIVRTSGRFDSPTKEGERGDRGHGPSYHELQVSEWASLEYYSTEMIDAAIYAIHIGCNTTNEVRYVLYLRVLPARLWYAGGRRSSHP